MRGLPGSPLISEEAGNVRLEEIGERDTDESLLLFDKTYSCPVCGSEFTARTLHSSKAARVRRDVDLRVRYKNIDPLKYRVIECAGCGYAAFDTDFLSTSKHELAAIRQQQQQSGGKIILGGEAVIGYGKDFMLYRSALRWSMIKHAQNSERANIFLHTAWLLRGWREANAKEGPEETGPATGENELKYLKYALTYFEQARLKEDYPVRGMDRPSLDYLMAALCYETGDRKNALRYLGAVFTDREANRQIKNMARDLKEML